MVAPDTKSPVGGTVEAVDCEDRDMSTDGDTNISFVPTVYTNQPSPSVSQLCGLSALRKYQNALKFYNWRVNYFSVVKNFYVCMRTMYSMKNLNLLEI